jgi:hypothetical protein
MKRLLLIIIFLEFSFLTFAQFSDWRLVSSGGGKNVVSGLIVHSSLGQLANQVSSKVYSGFQFQFDPLILIGKDLQYFEEKIKVYPNPASDFIQINSEKQILAEFILYDALGRIWIQRPFENIEVNVSVKSIPAGNYYILIKSDAYYFSQSLIINH